jgi:Zn finger protein HypA/HybF involved in hydrogenase expression
MRKTHPVIRIPTLMCERCTHVWLPRQPHVRMCPACKSTLWNVPPRTALEKWRYRFKQQERKRAARANPRT